MRIYMGTINIPKLQRKIKKELDADRYLHTLGVMYTAASLAMCYGEDIEKAQLAGLLHDCAYPTTARSGCAGNTVWRSPKLKWMRRICFTPNLALILPERNTA